MPEQAVIDLEPLAPALRVLDDDHSKLIAAMQMAQQAYGYLPKRAMEEIAQHAGVGLAKVYGIATFYSFFKLEPVGIYEILLCQGTACHVNGADSIVTAIQQELGITVGQTTEDGVFTLTEVACLGCCSMAPCMMINGQTYGHLTPETTIRTLRELRAIANGGGLRVAVGEGSCGIAAGAGRVERVLRACMTATDSFSVHPVGCIGMCFLEPIVDVYDGDKLLHRFVKVQEKDAFDIVAALRTGNFKRVERLEITDEDAEFLNKQTRIALRHCGILNPTSLADYRAVGGFQQLDKVLHMSPDDVIEEVKKSGIGGRGGAGFPTWFKWRSARDAEGEEKYLICNADEGDPGAFMDRAVIEGDPFNLLEGMLIGAYAIGAHTGFVYIRAEYPLAVERLQAAIDQLHEAGYLGEHILGTDFSCDIRIMMGSGAFVCGEETALLASLEGNRGMPRLKPPFPAQSGYMGKPSNINNVETYANITWIIERGGDAFAAIGTEGSKGTKVFAVSGKVKHGGLVEVPMGKTLHDVIFDIAGGMQEGHEFKAVQMGGPSGGCIPASMDDTLIDYAALGATGAIMGSGGMVVMDDDTCMVNTAKFFLNFTANESCGKCVPCRIGTKRMLEILTRLCEGKGEEGDIEKLEELSRAICDGAMCGLGQTAPNPVLTTIKYFRDEYEAHIRDCRCPAHECQDLITLTIDPDKCTGCDICARKCPVQCISGERKEPHVIDQDACIHCKQCYNLCHFGAITVE